MTHKNTLKTRTTAGAVQATTAVREPLVVYTARGSTGRPNVTLNGLDSPLETGQTTDASVTATATRDRGRRRHRFPGVAAPTPPPTRSAHATAPGNDR